LLCLYSLPLIRERMPPHSKMKLASLVANKL
jgi:hypothetical protein